MTELSKEPLRVVVEHRAKTVDIIVYASVLCHDTGSHFEGYLITGKPNMFRSTLQAKNQQQYPNSVFRQPIPLKLLHGTDARRYKNSIDKVSSLESRVNKFSASSYCWANSCSATGLRFVKLGALP